MAPNRWMLLPMETLRRSVTTAELLRSSKLLHLPRFIPPRFARHPPPTPLKARSSIRSKSSKRSSRNIPLKNSSRNILPQTSNSIPSNTSNRSTLLRTSSIRTRIMAIELGLRPGRRLRSPATPSFAGIPAATMPRTELYLDPWLLVLCSGRLLLGSWSLGRHSLHRRAMDPWVLELCLDRYGWHRGFWGRYIGYYGGVNYGNGYVGRGYYGGYWNHDQFNYNRQVTNVNNTVIHNTYITNVTNVTTYNRVSYSGGRGGVNFPPTQAELAALRQPRLPELRVQQQNKVAASMNRAQFASVNRPAADGRPGPASSRGTAETGSDRTAPTDETR